MDKHKNKKSYGDDIKKVLMILAGSALFTAEILEEVFGGTRSVVKNRERRRNSIFSSSGGNYEDAERQKFYSLLNRLRHQGFIKKKKSQSGSLWNITKKGLEKLGIINKKEKERYESKPDNKIRIVAFDVPENERWKRAWLREALIALDFSMLQQSVWMGKSQIPEQFLEDLRDKQMLNRVHILEVSATGTVSKPS